MAFKSKLLKPLARFIHHRVNVDAKNAIRDQKRILKTITHKARNTEFGKDHDFKSIKSRKDFVDRVPIADYEGLRSYIDLVVEGKSNILWPGLPKYLAKTSGTTSGVKYIPISNESVSNHFVTARNATFNHCHLAKNLQIFDGKLIFLSGSPSLTKTAGINTGRLSGIVNHEIPNWVKKDQMPSYETNMIDDWEEKLDKIVEETFDQDMRLISGIPPWVQMYYEKLLEKTGANDIQSLFPNFKLFTYGGVNFSPYQASLEKLTGAKILSLETFPASEGFIAFQDQVENDGLLLNTNSGIYFEFVPIHEITNEIPTRLSLEEVELDKDYVLIINSNAGLWGYNIGDTVRFVSKAPYKIIVSGRVKHFISAFGEHVIGKEVEQSIIKAGAKHAMSVAEFTVAPQVNPPEGELPYHEWLVEFNDLPVDLNAFANDIDEALQEQNIYYKDLRSGNVLQNLKLRSMPAGTFRKYMESQGKLGGQNKVPRLSNDRKIADTLLAQ